MSIKTPKSYCIIREKKYTWTEKDITCGRIICKSFRSFEANGWRAKWTFKIGWRKSNTYCLIAMTDGMIKSDMNKEDLIYWLNKNDMMPMPHEWFMATMDFLKDCYNSEE